MQTLSQIRELLASHSLAPRKAFGQNFLIDHNLIKKFVDAAAVGPSDTILEVGPGTGTLTEELLSRVSGGGRVIAAEIDKGLAALLREHFKDNIAPSENPSRREGQGWVGSPPDNEHRAPKPPASVLPTSDFSLPTSRFSLIEGDALATKRSLSPAITQALGQAPFKLVSNLPYGAATPIISTLLIDHPLCSTLTVTIQREVADRLMAEPGSKDFGTMSVIAQVAAEVKLITIVPLECFWPRPEVTSAMITLTRRAAPLTQDLKGLATFVQSLFEKRRKQLGAILGRSFPFPTSIDPTARAESLSIPELIELFTANKDAPPAP